MKHKFLQQFIFALDDRLIKFKHTKILNSQNKNVKTFTTFLYLELRESYFDVLLSACNFSLQ